MIIDDHPVVRCGISGIIRHNPNLNVCCLAASTEEAMAQITSFSEVIDLAIVDLSLNGESGFPLIKKLKNIHPDLRILVLSLHDEMVYAEKVIKAGAHGYIMKGEPAQTLLLAIDTVIKGDIYVSEGIHNSLLRNFVKKQKPHSQGDISNFTSAELIILELLAAGKTRCEIADNLNRSVKTVDTHCTNIKHKMNFPNNRVLIQFANQLANEFQMFSK